MADLDFTHKVGQIPAAQALPEPIQRTTGIERSVIPDYQTTFSNYASNSNWMSGIGSMVASKSSMALAQDLGNKIGQTPQGDLGPVVTDFDKTLQASYTTQAHATLGLQANKLITDSSLEMAKAPRITPDLIASTNEKVSLGLKNIFANAPNSIRPQLEYQYGSQQLSQNADLTERMIREQRQDRKANTANSSQVNAENAHALAMKGDYKGALLALDVTIKANQADVAAGISTPALAKTNIDTVRLSALAGKYSLGYDQARNEGKGEEFLRSLADKKPEDISDADYPHVVNQVVSYVNQQDTLRKQDQALAMAKFNTSLTQDPLGITGAQTQELMSKLDPIQQQQASLNYVKAIKKIQAKTNGTSEALKVYTDINKFPLQSSKNQSGAWEATYKAMLNRPENIAIGMTEDTAKLYAAAAAPVSIPDYVSELKAKLSTADPIQLESASQAVNYLSTHNLNQNLVGLGDEQYAMVETYGILRQTMDPVEAAQKAHETIYNKSKEQKDANKEALSAYWQSQKAKNESHWSQIKRLFQAPSDARIRNLPGYIQKSSQTFNTFFNLTNGDEATATKLTKQYLDNQYGASNINGDTEYMFHPVDKIPGIPQDATGPIQSDIVEQANKKFQEDKKYFDEGKSEYWFEVRQKISAEEAQTSKRITDSINEGYTKNPVTGLVFDVENKRQELNKHLQILRQYHQGQPITIVKHNRNGKDEIFEGAIQANPWGNSTGNSDQPVAGGWDFMMKTETGLKSIALRNPLNSSITYNPRVDYIQKLYTDTIGLSTFDYIARNDHPGLVSQHFNPNLGKILEQ